MSVPPSSGAPTSRVPDHDVHELVAGAPYTSPRPASPQAFAASTLTADLLGPFQRGRGGPGGWWILVEPELHLGADVLVPDLAGWRRARMPVIPDVAAFTLAPDWVAEILSPRTERLDRAAKLAAYARAGVDAAWLVSPALRTVEVYRNHDGRWTLLTVADGDDTRAALYPFDEVPLDLTALWLPGAPLLLNEAAVAAR